MPTPDPPRRRWASPELIGLVLVLALGGAVRLLAWNQVYAPSGVRFSVDSDALYHALRMRRAVASWPEVASRDPGLDYPSGAEVLWPPLFDLVGATAAKIAGGGHPDQGTIERAAAAVPVGLAVLSLLLVALLGRSLLGRGLCLDAVLMCALVQANVRFGVLGRVDQHIAEQVFFLWALASFARGVRAPSRILPAISLALALTLAFWNWQGSAFNLVFLAALVGLWHVCARPGDPSVQGMATVLARGAGLAAPLLAVSIAAFGPAGALTRPSLSGVTGFQALLCLVAAAFAWALSLLRRWRPADRVAARTALAAGAAGLALAPLLLPPLRAPIEQGMSALGGSGAWHATIVEYLPFFSTLPFAAELAYRLVQYGFLLVMAPLVLWAMARKGEEQAPAALRFVLAASTLLLLALTVSRNRFSLYAVPLLALAASAVLRAVVSKIPGGQQGPKRQVALALGTFLVVSPTLAGGLAPLTPKPAVPDELVALMKDLSRIPPAEPSRPAVLGRWPLGHAVQYYAGKPVVTSPFGTDAGPTCLQDWGAIAFSRSEDEVETLLARRKVGFLLLDTWADTLAFDGGFAPAGTAFGPEDPRNEDVILSRLYEDDGSARPGRDEPGLGHFRPVAAAAPWKVFAWVPGCLVEVRGAGAGALVVASDGAWTTRARAGEDGTARLRVPRVTARLEIASAGRAARAEVAEACVVSGSGTSVALMGETAVGAGK